MSDKLQQFLEGYAWLSDKEPIILCYLEAVERGEQHESIMNVQTVK